MSYEKDGCCVTVLCDVAPNGEHTPFLRKFVKECPAGQPAQYVYHDYELDGSTPYVVVGTESVCESKPDINQFEGLVLNPYCDIDTGEIVGYFAITRNENIPEDFETLYFDTTGANIPSQPANSQICETPEIFSWAICFRDGNGVEFNRTFHKDLNTNVVTYQDHDQSGAVYEPVGDLVLCSGTGATEILVCVMVADEIYTAIRQEVNGVVTFIGFDGAVITPDTWEPGPCQYKLTLGYINDCDKYDVELPLSGTAVFDNTPATTSTILVDDINTASFIRNEVAKALELNDHLVLHGLARIPVNIVARNNAGTEFTYSFYPQGLQAGLTSTLTITDTEVVAWGGNATRTLLRISYSTLDNCDCKPVEILELVYNNEVYLIDILDVANYDSTTGIKPSLLDVDNLLPLYTTGPFPGDCPEDVQVLDSDDLCCDDNLAENENVTANKRIAWLDAADTLDNLLDSIGGVPIAGNDGDVVGQVLDKIGGTNTFDEGGGPNGGPYYKLNRLNGLPGFQFLGDAGTGLNIADHFEIQLGAIPIGSAFQVFYLLKPASPSAPENACFLACGPNGGTQFAGQQGTWQISRGETNNGTQNKFVFRYNTDGTFTGNVDISLIPWATFANGLPHLITLFYDGTDVTLYLDGKKLLSFTPIVSLYSQFFRIFGNRQDQSYPSGDLYEMFISNGSLTDDEIALVNAYLICKWGIDPSQAVGGAGDLVLADDGAYNAPSPFVRLKLSDGTYLYRNTLNGQDFSVPPVPGLSVCRQDCIFCKDSLLTVIDERVTAATYSIPAGTLTYSIAIESGIATVNGALRPTSYVISQGPQSYSNIRLVYPQIDITGITGIVHINYVMES